MCPIITENTAVISLRISAYHHKGEILGIAGVEGNGQKELAEVITGIQKTGEGEILLDGQNLAGINIRGRMKQVFPIFQRTDCQTV